MPQDRNIQVRLASRPRGWPQASDFRFTEEPVPAAADGEFVIRSHYLSLDPYMRGRMNDGRSYVPPFALDEILGGEAVGEVISSRHASFPVGSLVIGFFGWQLYAKSRGEGVRRIEGADMPLTAWLGPLGLPGVTAYVGLLDLAAPKAGETVVVSAAAGAVGGIVGQIARLKGARAIGIAGGADKCRYVVEELGFDACLDYKSAELRSAFRQATPKGVDVYFDNVGGEILDLVLTRMNTFARVPVCGLISQYNATDPYGVKNFASILVNRIRVQGFIVMDHLDRWAEAQAALLGWVRAGQIKYRETIAQGIENAPAAFLGMLRGANTGKQLVKLI